MLAVATKSLKIVIIFNHLMLVDANCDDSVTIPRCPNLVVDLKVSVALKKKKLSRAYVRILGIPLFQNLDPPLHITRLQLKHMQRQKRVPHWTQLSMALCKSARSGASIHVEAGIDCQT